jgi:hypothetical protein
MHKKTKKKRDIGLTLVASLWEDGTCVYSTNGDSWLLQRALKAREPFHDRDVSP